jgi:hypothetical protein
MEYSWGPWFSHDGKGCPVKGQLVHVFYGEPICQMHNIIDVLSDREAIEIADGLGSWTWHEDWVPIIRYRVRRPLVSEWLAETTSDLPVTEDA